jgi:central kinetochore subunit Mis15/CHL4
MNDPRSLRGIVRNALPKALSQQNERYKLEATALTAKSLETMLALRGAGRTNEANGVFSIFADAVLEGTPIDPRQAATVAPEEYLASEDKENAPSDQQDLKRKGNDAYSRKAASPATKRRKLALLSRFGTSGTSSTQAMLNRLDIRLLDRLGDEDDDVNDEDSDAGDDAGDGQYIMSLSFTGNDVIAGFRKLAELGVVDPDRMPSWMTGEEGVSSAIIRRGKRVEPVSR